MENVFFLCLSISFGVSSSLPCEHRSRGESGWNASHLQQHSDERLDTQQTLAHLDKADNVNTNAHYTNIFQAKKKKNMLELDWFLEGAERVAWKSSPNKQLIYPPSL